jgi:ribosomal small subunit protein bTHX
MGKGDIRSKKGKIKNGSFGKSRSKRVLKGKTAKAK